MWFAKYTLTVYSSSVFACWGAGDVTSTSSRSTSLRRRFVPERHGAARTSGERRAYCAGRTGACQVEGVLRAEAPGQRAAPLPSRRARTRSAVTFIVPCHHANTFL